MLQCTNCVVKPSTKIDRKSVHLLGQNPNQEMFGQHSADHIAKVIHPGLRNVGERKHPEVPVTHASQRQLRIAYHSLHNIMKLLSYRHFKTENTSRIYFYLIN